uniref:Uncharacterized protein n=1 Tax=Cannabis sativa TaxID=3483 RepID=A0A803R1M9_CANSA
MSLGITGDGHTKVVTIPSSDMLHLKIIVWLSFCLSFIRTFFILKAKKELIKGETVLESHVMSQKEGSWATILYILSKRLSTPSSVFGGKKLE